ncbi:MAG: SPOR domain-containing protein [Chitinophagaceae bacterium]|nr:SPOR domain-containing protein [Chitinophagaceae bacterium]
MKSFFFLAFLAITDPLFSQDSTKLFQADSSTVVIHKDPRLYLLIKKQSEVNEAIYRASRRNVKGFRIMIINTNNRNDAINAKAKMYSYFPELKSYLTYQSPYFRLKVGNFSDRKDAEEYQKKISKYFSSSVFIVNDIIEVKPEDNLSNPGGGL